MKIRRGADQYLQENSEKNFKELVGYTENEKGFYVSCVLHFFQRLAIGCKDESKYSPTIDEKLSKQYFSDQLKYWYDEHFKKHKETIEGEAEFKEIIYLAKKWSIDKLA